MFDFLSFERYREFSEGSGAVNPDNYDINTIIHDGSEKWSRKFIIFKFVVDKLSAALSLPLVVLVGLVLLVINPIFNPGPLLFSQMRMGRNDNAFRMWKFRTMRVGKDRGPDAPLEHYRITKLGCFLRQTRIDELPNFLSVFIGHMSLVGPRPDAAAHAGHYRKRVQGYTERYRVRPGITGLAQVEMGYAEGEAATALKTKYDNIYASKGCGRLDLYILRRTFTVVFRKEGK